MEEKKPKKSTTEIIEREHDNGEPREVYRVLDDLIATHHTHLADAKIVLAWRFGWKPDQDGRLTLGQAKKVDDLNKDLHGYDFIILLNHEAYNAAQFTMEQQRALLDHELCHCVPALDEEGEQKTDEDNRLVWRLRGHDIEEFQEIVGRHGCWKSELEKFAMAALKKSSTHAPLFAGLDEPTGACPKMN